MNKLRITSDGETTRVFLANGEEIHYVRSLKWEHVVNKLPTLKIEAYFSGADIEHLEKDTELKIIKEDSI